jgi:hypothetical protein
MASISRALGRIKSDLEQILPESQIEDQARAVGHRWRKRKLTPAMTLHLFLLQLLAKVAMAGLRHVARISVSAQAICKAKQRLPLTLLLRGVEQVCEACRSACASGDASSETFFGHRVVLVDGTSFMTPDTPELAERFGKGGNGRGKSKGYPVPKLLALIDHGTGMIRKVIGLPQGRQEQTVLSRTFKYLSAGDLLMGDRQMGSFAHLAMLGDQSLHACIQLSKGLTVKGRGKGCRRQIKMLGKQDMLVEWRRPQVKPQWISVKAWAALPQKITLRQVTFRICRKGFKPTWVRVITTLLDPVKYPANQIAQLYAKRWRIEVCFRDLKQTLGLRQLAARSVAGVRKELACLVLLYNLTRQIMLRAAEKQQVAADRIGFKDTLIWLLWSEPGEALPELVVNPKRSRPSQPRRLKRGRKKYPPLGQSRSKLTRPVAEVKI